jgi:hypothetical protein
MSSRIGSWLASTVSSTLAARSWTMDGKGYYLSNVQKLMVQVGVHGFSTHIFNGPHELLATG